MKLLGKILLLISGSILIGTFVAFGLQVIGEVINWGNQELPRRLVMYFIVGVVIWYMNYMFRFYEIKDPTKKPKDIWNFWKDLP